MRTRPWRVLRRPPNPWRERLHGYCLFPFSPPFFFFCWRSIAGPELIWPGLSWARPALVYELTESHESIIISKAEFGEPWNAYFRRPQVLRVCEKLEGQENKKNRGKIIKESKVISNGSNFKGVLEEFGGFGGRLGLIQVKKQIQVPSSLKDRAHYKLSKIKNPYPPYSN